MIFYLILLALFLFAIVFFILFYFKHSMQNKWQESFKAISYDVMEKNTRSFLELTRNFLERIHEDEKKEQEGKKKDWEQLLKPIKEEMGKLDLQTRELERRREGAYAALSQQITALLEGERALRSETTNLVRALRAPNVRGSWGQMHLRRVVELAGMSSHSDFSEQKSFDAEGKIFRPDLIIHLPGDKSLVVDAKVPLDAYIEASETKDENIRLQKWKEHAAALRNQIKNLSLKEYWKQFARAPEYVILFLPAEAFFSAALEADHSLLEISANQNVIIATPTTLIAILRAVASVWKQEKLSQNAEQIASLGRELYDRMDILTDHWAKLAKSLNVSVEAFNQASSSLETRVLVSLRKLKEAGVGTSAEIKKLEGLDLRAKTIMPNLD